MENTKKYVNQMTADITALFLSAVVGIIIGELVSLGTHTPQLVTGWLVVFAGGFVIVQGFVVGRKWVNRLLKAEQR